jgi:hypothetical protein
MFYCLRTTLYEYGVILFIPCLSYSDMFYFKPYSLYWIIYHRFKLDYTCLSIISDSNDLVYNGTRLNVECLKTNNSHPKNKLKNNICEWPVVDFTKSCKFKISRKCEFQPIKSIYSYKPVWLHLCCSGHCPLRGDWITCVQ